MENEIQFDQVQRTAAAACSACREPLPGSYFQANGHILCEKCAGNLRNAFQSETGGFPRFAKAVAFGVGGGLAGSAVYTAVLALAQVNAALITILIGWLVGKGVSKGCGGRGGIGYQILAVTITWMAIGISTALSEVLSGENPHASLLAQVLTCIVGMFIGAALVGMSSILGAIITFFGLMRAWQMNRAVTVDITGPHTLAVSPTAPGA